MSMARGLNHLLLQRSRSVGIVLLTLLSLGLVTRPIEAPAWEIVKAGQPEMNLEAIEGSLGQGLVIGVLGGFRAVMADFLWIRTNTIWERRDRVKLDAMVRLVTTLDPRPDFFWINGARMIAYDVPNWRIREEGGYAEVSEDRQLAIDLEQAQQAFVMLARAREFHPENAKLYLETGQIYLNRLKDNVNAAQWFLSASQQFDAPYYAARIYGELLRREGKDVEAYAYLKQLFQQLPNDPYAQKPIILDRIKELEDHLQIPVWQRFVPVHGPLAKPSMEGKVYQLEPVHQNESCNDHVH
jgi:tetratricopeptide (TPR) repeat protein